MQNVSYVFLDSNIDWMSKKKMCVADIIVSISIFS